MKLLLENPYIIHQCLTQFVKECNRVLDTENGVDLSYVVGFMAGVKSLHRLIDDVNSNKLTIDDESVQVSMGQILKFVEEEITQHQNACDKLLKEEN